MSSVLTENGMAWCAKTRPDLVERGFRFLKDPLFYAESLYIKRGQSVEKQAMNIREEHRIVLRCLGPAYEEMYFL